MSTVSNTEILGFSRIPESASKTWTTRAVSTENLMAMPPSDKHRHLAIRSVSLSVQFSDLSEMYERTFTNQDDCSADALEFWRENREFWSRIEYVVSTEVEKFIKATRADSLKKNMRTMEAPLEVKTKFTNPSSGPPAFPSIPETLVSFSGDRARTIVPDESASMVTTGELQRLIDEMHQLRTSAHRRRSKKSKASSQTGTSFMKYVAGKN